jgi:hypothetical protein
MPGVCEVRRDPSVQEFLSNRIVEKVEATITIGHEVLLPPDGNKRSAPMRFDDSILTSYAG